MRKILAFLAMFLFSSVIAFGQLRDVAGQVVTASGEGVPFASVKIKGTNTGVKADDQGRFLIRASNGATLVVTSVSIKPKEFNIGNSSNVTIVTEAAARQEQDAVITAASGIKKSQRTQAYSAQVITAEQLQTTRQPNIVNGLAGKVAGTQVRGQSGTKLDQAAFLRVRGGSGIGGDRGAIFVVDGTIVNSFDINPDDVETMTVLKGANATVLFGERAANGAIVITTRKKVKNKLQVEYNQSVNFDDVVIMMRYQNKYAGGSSSEWSTFNYVPGMPAAWQALNGKRFRDYTDDASWGPRIDGSEYIPWYAWIPGTKYSGKTARLTAQPSNINDFWEMGVTTNTNLSMFKSFKKGLMRLTYNNTQIKGAIPNSRSGRNSVSLSASYDLTKKLTISTDANFTLNLIKGEFDDGYANNSTGSFSSWFHRDLDFKIMKELRGLKTPIGTLATWNPRNNPNNYNPANPGNFWKANYWYNPYAYYDNITNETDRSRMFGNIRLAYKINKDLNITATWRNNSLNTEAVGIVRSILESSALQTGYLAGYSEAKSKFRENNYEFIANYKKAIKKFDIDAYAGGNLLDQKNYANTARTDGGLVVPDKYELSNSVNPVVRNIKGPKDIINHVQNRAFFGNLDISYNKFLNFNSSYRQDFYSIAPPKNNSLASFSYGAGFIFSDLLKDKMPWLSYGKVFASVGQKPLAPPIGWGATDPRFLSGGNYVTYAPSTIYWNTDTIMNTPNTAIQGDISGIVIDTKEYGAEFKFLKNRLGITVTYYDETVGKEPVRVAIPGTSGYTSRLANVGTTLRQGIEIESNFHIIKRKELDWRTGFNISKILNNKVTDIDGNPATNSGQFLLSGGAFGSRFARAFTVEGKDAMQLIGGGIARNEDGLPLIKADGTYQSDPTKNWGSAIPKVTGGLFNNITYGNFTLAVNIDYQFGGKFFSLSEAWGSFSGLLDWTAGVNDRGKEIRDPVAAGGGVRVRGVSAADRKTPVDMYINAQDYFHQFYNNQIAEPFIHSLSFIKLREVAVGYNLPVSKMKIGKWAKSANFSIMSRNPLLIYREAQNFDPSEISGIYGEDGNLPPTRSLGVNLRVIF